MGFPSSNPSLDIVAVLDTRPLGLVGTLKPAVSYPSRVYGLRLYQSMSPSLRASELLGLYVARISTPRQLN